MKISKKISQCFPLFLSLWFGKFRSFNCNWKSDQPNIRCNCQYHLGSSGFIMYYWIFASFQILVSTCGSGYYFQVHKFWFGDLPLAEEQGQNSTKPWVLLLVRIPVLFAKLIKYVLLFPLYELAKAIVGHKVLGIVKKKVNYYADAADWYIEQLINNNPDQMTRDELFHLSYIYSELSDVKANTNDNSRHTSYSATSEKPPQDKGQNGTEKATGTYTNATPKQQVSENKFAGIAIACILVIGLSLGIYFLFFNKSSKATELVQGDILLSVPGKYPQGSQRILTVEELSQ
ncbi:MAG: hypothetical protein WDO19_30195 [Bacteroidota bacterium]